MTFKPIRQFVVAIAAFALITSLYAINQEGLKILLKQAVVKEFKGLKATHYSHKTNYSKTVPDLYLAYDKDGTIIGGAAYRKYKTYAKVTSMVVISRKNGALVVSKADIPDYFEITDGKKLVKVMDAVKAVNGKVVRDASGKAKKIDAVSGATRYQKRLYLNFDLLSRTILKEMDKKPAWPKAGVK